MKGLLSLQLLSDLTRQQVQKGSSEKETIKLSASKVIRIISVRFDGALDSLGRWLFHVRRADCTLFLLLRDYWR